MIHRDVHLGAVVLVDRCHDLGQRGRCHPFGQGWRVAGAEVPVDADRAAYVVRAQPQAFAENRRDALIGQEAQQAGQQPVPLVEQFHFLLKVHLFGLRQQETGLEMDEHRRHQDETGG